MDQGQVLVASAAAYEAGVRTGMRAGGVVTIAPETVMLDRDPGREAAAMEAIALALLQFTPEVSQIDSFSMTLDVSASLRLFGGPLALCRRVRERLHLLGYSNILGAAPTAVGAWLLSHDVGTRHRRPLRRCLRQTTLAARLNRLDCAVLPAARPFLDWFRGIGATDLGAVRRLPRAGLQRRTNKNLLLHLDHAYGERCEMLRWISVPATFSARIETLDRIENAELLMAGATTLILQMTGWLTFRQLAVRSFTLQMEHERGRAAVPPTPLDIKLAEPTWKEQHLLRLLKERLAKVELHARVIGLHLMAGQLEPMAPPTGQLFPEPGGSSADFKRLLELLTARLGPEYVLTPAAAFDHRPEQCNAWVPATQAAQHARADDEKLERPCWVLPKPIPLLMRSERPFYGSPLKLIRGPERLEAGWWDDQTIARDYYVAQGTDATCYWIYLERTDRARWYLHGLYA